MIRVTVTVRVFLLLLRVDCSLFNNKWVRSLQNLTLGDKCRGDNGNLNSSQKQYPAIRRFVVRVSFATLYLACPCSTDVRK